MKNLLLQAVFIAATALMSCNISSGERIDGNGNLKSENRKIGNATKINVLGDIDVFVEVGSTALRVEADENLLPYIETVEEDGWLRIKTRDHTNINTGKSIKVYITTPTLRGVSVDGSGNLKGSGSFSSVDNMSLNVSGSGNINLQVNAPKVESAISGSGNLHVAGETRDVEVHISGSGNYDGPDLKAENASVSIAGSGDAHLFADVNLKASIAGSGNVKYKGNASVEQSIAGSGSVQKIQ
ncbi:MAG: hypothetical protein JWQ40_4438 [Segetibacter sp.]|nr:hypothetical protein [Segetibacter sp.]